MEDQMKAFYLTVLATFMCVGTADAQPVYLNCANSANLVFDEAIGQAGYQNDTLYSAKFTKYNIMWDSMEQRRPGDNKTLRLVHHELDREHGIFSEGDENWNAIRPNTTCTVGAKEPATKF
jgi:hypothetical protein